MENTYDWIIATADSKVKSNTWASNRMFNMYIFNLEPELPNKVTNKWPAIIFAVSRIAKVIGRIILLVVSIITKNGRRTDGAPWGTR